MSSAKTIAYALFSVSLAAAPVLAQERDRSKIDNRYKWNLSDIYPSDAAWKQAKDKLVADIPELQKHQGKLASSPQALAAGLERLFSLQKDLGRIYVYASMTSDQDTRDSRAQGMKEEISGVASQFSAAAAFIEPEVLALGKSRVDTFLQQEPKLKTYRVYLSDISRRAAHTGTEGEEKIIADAGLMARGPQNIFGIFSNADFPYPEVTLSDGNKVKLDQAAFQKYRAGANREDRKKVMAAYFGALGQFRGTFGAELNANVQKDLFYMKARKYKSSLESALDGSNIPVSVYKSLVDGVNASLPSFHRYLKLRQRMLGVDQLRYHDLYAPLVASADLNFPIAKAEPLLLASLAPLGKDYVAVVKEAMNKRWIDLYPNAGKRSGAYSNGGAYDVHPYMLLNYNDKYNDLSTLTHELGHTMQSYYSNKTQPFATADYPTFVAEVASTYNEALLIDHMLKTIKDDATRLSLLGEYLEGIKGTVFRQTQFAEFELRIHEMAERGEPLTGDTLTKLYDEITKKYYGHDKGICLVDDEVKYEWAAIPHFYYNFYVFQYATSFTASSALSEKALAKEPGAIKRFRNFLAAGGSKYPIELLKDAGVDMNTSEPLELTMKKMNRVMDEMEKLLAARK